MNRFRKTRLSNPDICKVDLVDAGANPPANIMLYKRKEGSEGQEDHAEGGDNSDGMIKTLFSTIGKALGWKPEAIEKAVNAAVEGQAVSTAVTFDQKLYEQSQRRIAGEIWDYTYALEDSLTSIMRDATLDGSGKQDLLIGTLDQFYTAISAAIPKWCGGETVMKAESVEKASEVPLERMERIKKMRDKIDELIKEQKPKEEPLVKNKDKEGTEMNIDKSKLTAEEVTYLEGIEKRAKDAEAAEAAKVTAETALAKMKEQHPDPDDIYKGLHPAVKKELEDLKKAKDESAKKEFVAKAAGYAPLGVKAEEFGPVLKAIADKCPDEFTKVEEVLKSASVAVEKGDLFKEQGSGAPATGGTAEQQLSKKAEEIAKRDNIAKAAAWEKAGNECPELLAKYREEMRG